MDPWMSLIHKSYFFKYIRIKIHTIVTVFKKYFSMQITILIIMIIISSLYLYFKREV